MEQEQGKEAPVTMSQRAPAGPWMTRHLFHGMSRC